MIRAMVLPRNIYNQSPPDARSRDSNNPTLLYSWWCTIFSVVVIGFRVCGRYIRNERLFREDKVMFWSIIPLMARMAFVHVVLIYGTNNVNTSALVDPLKIKHREMGSRMVLGARICYALFIWMAKFTVSEFLKRMTERFWKRGYEFGLRGIRIFLVATFLAVFIATLAECHPFNHYWQVIPDPGAQCRQGYAHLLAMGIADIITDILLVIFPIPIILFSGMPMRRKLSLVALFSMSVILIAITGARIPLVIEKRGLQQFRTVFASSEILAATFVSNAIILGSFLRDRGVKKQKYKFGSTTDSMDLRSSARRPVGPQYASDENLARSLGYRTNPELTDQVATVARPAPVVDVNLLAPPATPRPFSGSNWQFPNQKSCLSQCKEESDEGRMSMSIEDPHPSPRGGRRVSFFDVGGLLEDASHPSTAPSPTDSIFTHDFATVPPKRGSRAPNSQAQHVRAFLPSNRRSSRLSQQPLDHEMSSRPSQQLQDLGGFLRETGPENAPSDSTASNSQTTLTTLAPPPSIVRSPTETSFGSLPSIQDSGGLLSTSPFKSFS